jgi:hypothetical protein
MRENLPNRYRLNEFSYEPYVAQSRNKVTTLLLWDSRMFTTMAGIITPRNKQYFFGDEMGWTGTETERGRVRDHVPQIPLLCFLKQWFKQKNNEIPLKSHKFMWLPCDFLKHMFFQSRICCRCSFWAQTRSIVDLKPLSEKRQGC